MRSSIRLAVLGIIATWLLGATSAQAMPMFARKYHMDCSGCHDALTYPRLNATGYKFRRAGFRMPETIGQEEVTEFSFGDYFSGRIQSRFTADRVSDKTTPVETTSTTDTFEMREITLYPITGSFLENWASETEISMAPDETPELENAYVRGVWGDRDFWFEARGGLFHPYEGIGGSDRSLGVSRPLFETQGANQNQDTLFRIWGVDQVGVEAGIQWHDFSLSSAVVNGITPTVEEGKTVGVGITTDSNTSKDVIVMANQLFGERSSVSAYYAHGTAALPVDPAGFVDGSNTMTFDDDYDRIAAFGAFGLANFTVMGGGELGFDKQLNADGTETRFRSQGAFVEGDVAVWNHAVTYLRLDYFDPSADKDKNIKYAATAGASIFDSWVYVTPELQVKDTQGQMGDKLDLSAIVHAVVIY
jgi:hypothetical protein